MTIFWPRGKESDPARIPHLVTLRKGVNTRDCVSSGHSLKFTGINIIVTFV